MNQKSNRLEVLDGLRGLAIIFVVLNHIDGTKIIANTPSWMRFFVDSLFGSGGMGVAILFVLCGFLMAYLYPAPKRYTAFLQKRYTRIFPLFISMSIVMFVLRLFPYLHPIIDLAILFFVSYVTHLIWAKIVQKQKNQNVGKIIFFSFLIFQGLTLLWYLYVIVKVPSSIFYQILSPQIREFTVFIVNTTLTLPFGNYVPMLDGVYWSLASEVLFYILYPVLFVPITTYVQKMKKIEQILFMISFIPFFVGITLISTKILGLGMLQLYLFIFFVTGITLGVLYRTQSSLLKQLNTLLKVRYITIGITFFWIVLLFLTRWIDLQTAGVYHMWVYVVVAIPITFGVATLLEGEYALVRFLKTRAMIFLGTISYSLYLCHIFVVNISKKIYIPHNGLDNVLTVAITVSCAVGLAYVLNKLLEQPYFESKNSIQVGTKITVNKSYSNRGFIILLTLYIFSLLFAFRPPFSFFSSQSPHSTNNIISPKLPTYPPIINLALIPDILFRFNASKNNLGIVTMDLKYKYNTSVESNIKENAIPKLTFKIKESGSSAWHAESSVFPVEVGSNSQLPFGFQPISASKGKNYDVSLHLENGSTRETLWLKTSPTVMQSYYFPDKKEILKNPFLFIKEKWIFIFAQNEVQQVILFGSPIFFISLFSLIRQNRKIRA
ncbi:MAG: acyltransferase [Candidatus Roizmanbacteria bacterium]